MARLLNQRSANSTRRGFLKTTAAMTLGSAALVRVAGTGTQSIEAAAATPDISTLPWMKQTTVEATLTIICHMFRCSGIHGFSN